MSLHPASPARLDELREQLGGSLPSGVDELSDADVARLVASLRRAKARQRQELQAAIDNGMTLIPALLRRPLKKILFP